MAGKMKGPCRLCTVRRPFSNNVWCMYRTQITRTRSSEIILIRLNTSIETYLLIFAILYRLYNIAVIGDIVCTAMGKTNYFCNDNLWDYSVGGFHVSVGSTVDTCAYSYNCAFHSPRMQDAIGMQQEKVTIITCQYTDDYSDLLKKNTSVQRVFSLIIV